MTTDKREIVIAKEDAVFWMDERGRWQNEHGTFEHAKIIDYFHSSIQKDDGGFYLFQENEEVREKVYFRYVDTAFFVFDVTIGDTVTLTLNTKRQITMQPQHLLTRDDSLFYRDGDDLIKFAERGLVRISDLLETENDRLFVRLGEDRFEVPVD